MYEIGPAFRNEGQDATHNPEFTTCEFYAAYHSLSKLINMTGPAPGYSPRPVTPSSATRLQACPGSTTERYAGPYRRLQFIPALQEGPGLQPPGPPRRVSPDDLRAELARRGLDDWGGDGAAPPPQTMPQLLDRLGRPLPRATVVVADARATLHHAPPGVYVAAGKVVPVQRHRPACLSPRRAVRRRHRASPTCTRRRTARSSSAPSSRDAGRLRANNPDGDDDATIVDESYISALYSGLPPTGGWGCGIDRLVMLLSGATRISDCMSFGSLSNVVGLAGGASGLIGRPTSTDAFRVGYPDTYLYC